MKFDRRPANSQILRQLPDLAADRRHGKRWLLQGDAFNNFLEFGRNLAVLAGIGPLLSCKAVKPNCRYSDTQR